MDISVFISDLLFEHDCVIVPGFGGFICNYRPAEIHPVLHIINPPSKSISFNVNLSSNDGLLVNYIANTGGLTFAQSQDLVSNWVSASKGLLKRNETLVLKKIGRIFSDIEGNVQFAPDDSVNYLKTSFALRPITAQPVLRGKEVDYTERFVEQTKKHSTSQRSVWKIAAMVFLVMGIAALIQMMRMGVELKPLGFNEASVFSFFTHFTGNHEDSMQPLPVEIEKPNVVEAPKVETPIVTPINNESPVVKKSAPVITETGHGYYIIVGAFSENKNAESAKAQLQNRLSGTPVFSDKSGRLTRVGYAVGNDAGAAQQQLHAAQIDNPSYWLLKK
jgi:CCDC81-like HU domain protein/sporulation related protein